MAAVTICSDFGAQKNKVWHCFHCFPIYRNCKSEPWWDTLHTHEGGWSERQIVTSVGEDLEKLESPHIAGKDVKWCNHCEKQCHRFLKYKYKHCLITQQFHSSVSWKHVHINTCTWIFIATLFLLFKRWEQPKCPSVEGEINRTWSSHMMEYYSAVKRNKVLTLATTWMNFKTFCQVKEVGHKRPSMA